MLPLTAQNKIKTSLEEIHLLIECIHCCTVNYFGQKHLPSVICCSLLVFIPVPF